MNDAFSVRTTHVPLYL